VEEVATARIAVRVVEFRIVREIEGFYAEFDTHGFRNLEVTEQRRIQIHPGRTAQNVPSAGAVAIVSRTRGNHGPRGVQVLAEASARGGLSSVRICRGIVKAECIPVVVRVAGANSPEV